MRLIRPEDATPEDIASLKYGELSPDELKEVYALAQAAFTAEDLQRYTETDEGVPAEEVVREMEEAQREFERRQK
jgi:hypothetical protein